MTIFKSIIRRLIWWLFKDRVKVYQAVWFVSDLEQTETREPEKLMEYRERDHVRELAYKLWKDRMINVTRVRNDQMGADEFRMEMYCLEFPEEDKSN